MFGKRFSRALAVTTVASLIMATAAFADGTVVDGDLTVVANNSLQPLDLGTICVDESNSGNMQVLARRSGGNPGTPNVWNNASLLTASHSATNIAATSPAGTTVTVTVPAAPATDPAASASGSSAGNKIRLPNAWGDATPNTLSAPVTVGVEVAAGSNAGSFSAELSFNLSGAGTLPGNQGAGTLVHTGKQTVTATISNTGACAPLPSDTTPPVITPGVTGTLGNNGWYTSDVTVSWTVTDLESAFTSSGCGTTTITADTAGTTLTCSATSAGGPSSQSVTIKRDATAPSTTASASPGANTHGWNNSNVTVSFSGTDALSDIDFCSADVVLSSEGSGQSASGTCTDKAGNVSASATASGINIDRTAPSVSLVGGPSDGGSYYFGFVPSSPTCSASDALSGLDGSCSVSGYSAGVGSHTVTASATDRAGNNNSASASYSVLNWTTSGFYSPVNMSPTGAPRVWNTIKGGQTVPLKFEIFAGAVELTETTRISLFRTTVLSCESGESVEDPIEITSTGGTTLRYDATAGQFIQNWQTPKTPGRCYVATVSFQDGSSISAYFKTK